jgi:hypothetical protein
MSNYLGALFLLFFSINSFAQLMVDKVIPPSPNAAVIIKYCDHPAGQQNGIPEIKLPIHELKYDDISIPISLNYHTLGIKVEEEATWAGLGWYLNAGGMITRIVRGKDDLGLAEQGDKAKAKGYPFEHIKPCFDDCQENENDDFHSKVCEGEIDSDPDIFFFDILGTKGKFLLTPDHKVDVDTITIKTGAPTNLEIKFSMLTNSWKVQDSKGFAYYFRSKERTETHRNYFDLRKDSNKLLIKYYSDFATTSWYLDEVVSPNGAIVYFRYDIYSNGDSPYASNGTNHKMNINDEDIWDVHYSSYCFPDTIENVQILSESVFSDVYLKSIRCGDYKVDFKTSDRDDIVSPAAYNKPKHEGVNKDNYSSVLKGPQKLDKLIITKNGQLLEKYEFEYSNFNQNKDSEYNCLIKRLRLDKIAKTNKEGVKSEDSFSYIENYGLPSKTSHARDVWGYYNGEEDLYNITPSDYYNYSQPEKLLQPEGRTKHYSLNHLQEGMLNRIQYSNGKILEYSYDHQEFTKINDEISSHFEKNMKNSNFSNETDPFISGGLRIKEISETFNNEKKVRSFEYKKDGKETGTLIITNYDHDHNGYGHKTSGNHNVLYHDVAVTETKGN